MADMPTVKITDRLLDVSTYKKYAVYVLITILALLLLMGGISLWRWIFPKPEKQTTNQKVVTTPFSTVEKGGITQTSTQIQVTEKPWEVGVGGGGLTYDNKSGVFIGGFIKRKF